jgi:hypothetical protein
MPQNSEHAAALEANRGAASMVAYLEAMPAKVSS